MDKQDVETRNTRWRRAPRAVAARQERVRGIMQENVDANFDEGAGASGGRCQSAVLSWGQDLAAVARRRRR